MAAAAAARDLKLQLQRWVRVYPQDAPDGMPLASGDQDADRVEAVVRRMRQQGRWKEARVLRVESAIGAQPEQERLRRLSRLGLQVSRTSYYAYLNSALAFVEGALSREN